MEISLQLFLYIFYGFLAIYLVFIAANLYHLIKFGFLTFGNVLISFLFIAITVILIYYSLAIINNVNWDYSFTVFNMTEETSPFMP
ncbi:MAG: hypothetical protein ABIC82_03070 [bacterium]